MIVSVVTISDSLADDWPGPEPPVELAPGDPEVDEAWLEVAGAELLFKEPPVPDAVPEENEAEPDLGGAVPVLIVYGAVPVLLVYGAVPVLLVYGAVPEDPTLLDVELAETIGELLGLVYELEVESAEEEFDRNGEEVEMADDEFSCDEDDVIKLELELEVLEVVLTVEEEELELELELDVEVVGEPVRHEQAEDTVGISQSFPGSLGRGMPPNSVKKSQNAVGSGSLAVSTSELKQLALLQLASSLTRNSFGTVVVVGGGDSMIEVAP